MANGRKSKRRLLHWTMAVVFLVMVLTGSTLLIPAFSGLAAGGWTRLIHKIAAVALAAVPLVYIFINRPVVRQWFGEAALWRKAQSKERYVIHSWRRWHKLILSIGLMVFIVTGSIQWFLKGAVPSSVFNVSILVHDVAFFSALLVLLYHVYFELVWWLWRRRYCSRCKAASCAASCPVNAVFVGDECAVKRNMQVCNRCRLCMKACQREGYYIGSVSAEKADSRQVD